MTRPADDAGREHASRLLTLIANFYPKRPVNPALPSPAQPGQAVWAAAAAPKVSAYYGQGAQAPEGEGMGGFQVRFLRTVGCDRLAAPSYAPLAGLAVRHIL